MEQYENVDFLTSNMLPLGAVFTTFFAAWIMSKNSTSEELGGHGVTYRIWRFLANIFLNGNFSNISSSYWLDLVLDEIRNYSAKN